MNAQKSSGRNSHRCLFSIWIVFCLFLAPIIGIPQARERSVVQVLVQAADAATASAAVQRLGGTVTRELSIINSVAADVPSDEIGSLRSAPGVMAVWLDETVKSADSADPGTIYSPYEGAEAMPASFDVTKVSACDGARDNLDFIPRVELSPLTYQSYAFTPVVPSQFSGKIQIRFLFKEKSLNQAQLQVFQSSTRTWYSFDIYTQKTNDALIDSTFDLSGILTSADDLNNLKVRFLASHIEGGEKAEVDCVNLYVDGRPYAPSSGAETKPAGFDLKKVLDADPDREIMDFFPVQNLNPNAYQSYTFNTTVDPTNLPALIDLNFTFREKSLNQAQIQVFQTSTRTWHNFDIDTSGTDDKVISVILDLTDILVTPEDFNQIEVRFLVSKNAGGEKAEVDLVSLRLANLIGETTSLDVARSFEAVNAVPVWMRGNTGLGIGVAVLDSGVKRYQELEKDTRDQKIGLWNGWNAIQRKNDGRHDQNGHGTLVASIISNQRRNSQNQYFGVAPDSVVIPVQVLDRYGRGSYSQVIDGIQWVIDHKNEYNIRVMNLSLSAPVRSHYWDDPLNQAVMKAWQAGIVVVVAAGNGGPDPMTIGVPGNNPYVITVGALTDAYTPADLSDDYVPTFSAAGPTHEGFVKPDLVAPGGHIVGLMSDKCELAQEHPGYKIDKDYYKLTGTSMSAAQVSGVVALMLANNPNLTPDQVKYRLLASALPAVTSDGKPAFSIWQQGTGRVNAYQAVYGNLSGTANQGLDINADLLGTRHFAGLTQWNPDTRQYYLVDLNGQPVGDGFIWGGGVAWSESYTWGGGVAWSEAYTRGGGVAWSEAYTWGGGVAWSEAYTLGGGVAWSETIPWAEASAVLVSWKADE